MTEAQKIDAQREAMDRLMDRVGINADLDYLEDKYGIEEEEEEDDDE